MDWLLWLCCFGSATCTGVIENDLVNASRMSEIDLVPSGKSDIELRSIDLYRHSGHCRPHRIREKHHDDDYGAAEYYSRDDANMLLATATALIASSLARLQSSEVHGLGAAKV